MRAQVSKHVRLIDCWSQTRLPEHQADAKIAADSLVNSSAVCHVTRQRTGDIIPTWLAD
jgi:hypothetical protein